MEQKVTSPAAKGLVLALILIVVSLGTYFSGQTLNSGLRWLSTLVFMGGIIWACISFAKQMDGNITFGNAFAHGFKTTAATTAIVVVYTFIFIKFIYPGMVDLVLDQSRQELTAKGKLTSDQIDSAMDITRRFFSVFAVGGALLLYLCMGAIAALIGAAVAKKNPNPEFPQ